MEASKLADRWALEVRGTISASPQDDKSIRLDGSHLTARYGNWLLSASTLDRWWGPGNGSSLILSNNARPMPALVLERATSTAFRLPVLKWAGPWRFTTLVGQMESDRADVENPLFLGMRVSFRPARFLEIGLSRTAQFCGEGRSCTLDTLQDVLGFNDTVGETVSFEDQPGNQLAGWDVRIASPWPSVPIAIYKQDIGEDRIDIRPTDRMALYGLESWLQLGDGGTVRGYVEYADTTCAAESSTPVFNCAYTNNVFSADGYRYRHRAIGHTTDADSASLSAGLRWTRPAGDEWSLEYWNAELNRDPGVDPNHSIAPQSSDYQSFSLGWRAELFRGTAQIQIGMERIEAAQQSSDDQVFGFLGWRRHL